MHSTGFSHTPFSSRDPVRAAEEDIRRYLIRRGVITPPGPCEPRTGLCLLAIYAALALVVVLGLLVLARLECDPLFSDRGLKAICRGRAVPLTKIVGPASDSSFMSVNLPQ